jgi:hypothetical protein
VIVQSENDGITVTWQLVQINADVCFGSLATDPFNASVGEWSGFGCALQKGGAFQWVQAPPGNRSNKPSMPHCVICR